METDRRAKKEFEQRNRSSQKRGGANRKKKRVLRGGERDVGTAAVGSKEEERQLTGFH